ncbi:MAG: cobalamin biosynthesis protein CbiD [Deltaproteobacteria bacterium]|nr:cobalamin biosynthesis protein CbiD [Deltaproteobacteria bacterium]
MQHATCNSQHATQRTGFTTGTCAAAAAKAAAMLLDGLSAPEAVTVTLPDGSQVKLPISFTSLTDRTARAGVKKDAGDDPDVTDGCLIIAEVTRQAGPGIELMAGEGVGTVTKPGLQIPPGQPAINPIPRMMIRQAVAEVTSDPMAVVISIPGGADLAQKTFNPRLGVVGGLSILGTSGIVRPFSHAALTAALKCALNVAVSCRVASPIFVPGRIGAKAAARHFKFSPEQLIEVSNEWGFMLYAAASENFARLLVLGHPGKLAKLINGDWDTHSSRSQSAIPLVTRMTSEICSLTLPDHITMEGLFDALTPPDRAAVAKAVAADIGRAVAHKIGGRYPVTTALVNTRGDLLGTDGDLTHW